ncbi:hypothetical protein Pmar_PMAR028695 [Perkinsus marinus ATCC 50983]|uniref:Carbohydrate kinase PfkB domain-containing protein n=1 Tax=Perkinsus marinus (strain ATCC 50983 / TXsc) TaxID=423536 RepID=C5K8M2_PERM5|nr:hypothetical protein Pmar_PMAR028695 [Perkinsus marinus ATCC 50983]EER19229.1 hypothetical protein Pmar_PMAR028695 [Perkinsus marinus ATCC 50983]|eukprot:XP_002787433.1 hypothetical protein Pmar_PMAR028695 [Perkinsus marinus ATCC 50983]
MDSPYPRWEPTILCVGLVCRDITVEVPTYPRPDSKMMPDEIPMMKFQHYWDSTQVSCLYLDGRFPYVAEVYAIEASQRKVPIVMDVERADRDKLNELLVLCTGIVVSGYHTLTEVEDTLYGGVNLFDKCSNLEWMVVTMGKDGAEMILRQDRKKRERIPPHVVDDVVDTTGAGDAFQAGLVYSMCKRRMQQQEKETDV